MKYEFDLLEGEYWWGGTTGSDQCPLTKSSDYHFDFRTICPNQTMPLFLSSEGRVIASSSPFKADLSDGRFVFEGENVTLTKAGNSLREAFLAAQHDRFVSDGRELPDVFFRTAQYNTWMEYTYYPTQAAVLEFARAYVTHGFAPGILIIDEGWQERYGCWRFDKARFPDPKVMVDELHRMGFKVLLWVVPYVSADGPDFVRSLRPLEGTDPEMAKHLYMRTKTGDIAIIRWWNGFGAILNMADPWNEKFLDNQLQLLMKEYGVDGFKFDGGTVNAYSGESIVNGEFDTELTPHQLNQAWNRFGTRYEYHEYKDTYGLGGHNCIQRLRDKGHRWTGDGINQLIPCAMTCGLIGHPFICPDMIGGGEWSFNFLPGFHVDEELFVRMAQCSALFPMMQFSWAPWRVLSEENVRYCAEAAALHQRMSGEILELVHKAEQNGEPILRALEYNAPHQGLAAVRDEFMLGDDILVAPVVTKGTRERTVLFPHGYWQDEDGIIYDMTEKQSELFQAPLSKLLWFRRVTDAKEF